MTTKNSDLVANFEASPQIANDSQELHGVLRVAQGTVALAAGDSTDNDIVMLAPIPSNASITAIQVAASIRQTALLLTKTSLQHRWQTAQQP